MNWLQISNLGSNKVVKSMMIWMLVTPIVAKALSSVESINISFLQTDQSIALSLPFSWQVFFFCALSFTVANIIYTIKCPALISKYKNYADFESKDNSLYLVVSEFNQHVNPEMIRSNFLEIGVIVSKYSPAKDIALEWTSDDTSNVNWRKGIDSLRHAIVEDKPDIFASLRILLGKLNSRWAFTCVVFYVLGFIGMGFVMLQNIMFVCKQFKF
ncbi:hypothetical protein P4S57_17205 [Pseudoalteromonas sp. Hal273]